MVGYLLREGEGYRYVRMCIVGLPSVQGVPCDKFFNMKIAEDENEQLQPSVLLRH